jgi:thioredoxin-dependent peroxiredoxin
VDGTVASAYGAKRKISALGNQRKTFVIDTDHKVLAVVHSEISFQSHADKALAILRDRAG